MAAGRLTMAHYADPGYQADHQPRYALDNEEEVRAAWGYINQRDNARRYTPEQRRLIHQRIQAAGRKYGIQYGHARGFDNPSCDYQGDGMCSHGVCKAIPLGGGAHSNACLHHFRQEMAFRKERNATLDPEARFDLPRWEDLRTVEGSGTYRRHHRGMRTAEATRRRAWRRAG